MKTLLSILLLAVCFVVPTATPTLAAELQNVGPRGDKSNSGDLYSRRYARLYERWKTGEFDEGAQQQAAVEQRYRNAPQTALLAQEDPSMPSMLPAQNAGSNCPPCNCTNQQAAAMAAPRMPVQQQSLQPLYTQQNTNTGRY